MLIGKCGTKGLLSRDSDNKVQPGLAKSWDISNDGTTYTFHLNENMNFSNGDTLDAEDVAWSINQLKEQQYYNANQVESLEKAEAVDSDTVKLTLSTPDSNLLWYLTGRPGLVFDKDAEYNAKTEPSDRARTRWNPSIPPAKWCSKPIRNIGEPRTSPPPRTW